VSSFREITGPQGHGVPSTRHDAWLRVSGSAPDATWEQARAANHAIGDVALLAAEQGRLHLPRRPGHGRLHRQDGTA
jgi:hypothetical protein